jgi:hypothetical protein
MRKSSPVNPILQSKGLIAHYLLGRAFKLNFVEQCCAVAMLVAIGMLAASLLDQSLVLAGQNVGLLEHQALWGFPLLQVVGPLCIKHSFAKAQRVRLRNGEITESKGPQSALVPSIRRFLNLEGKGSQIAAAVVYLIGFAAIVWNTYQNQRPGIAVPYDFWDSKNFVWGFVFTRIYKLYLFGWLLPYLGMIQIAIIVVTLRFVRHARKNGKLKLFPFHPDGVGGLGFVASLISTPVIITVVVGALATSIVFFAHHGVATTPLIALAILIGWILTAYFIPIVFLRSDIVALKKDALNKLRRLQQENYSQITVNHPQDLEMLGKGKEALDYFDKVCTNIQEISDYPHLKRLLSLFSLSMIPSLVQIAIKLYQNAGPIFGPLLKTN